MGMAKEAKLYCMGVLKGIYRYEMESKSEFKDWAEDVPGECFGYLLGEWRERTPDKDDIREMGEFIEKECGKRKKTDRVRIGRRSKEQAEA